MSFPSQLRLLAVLAISVLAVGPVAAQEIPVAIFNALTGTYAYGGIPIQNGMRMALEEANANHVLGNAKLRIFEGDTAGEKSQSLNLVNQFARRDKVLLIMGPTTSSEALGAVGLANELQVPMLASGTSNDIPGAGPWTFKIQSFATDIMGMMVKYVSEKTDIKRLATVIDPGNDGFVTQKAVVRDGLKAKGVQIVSEDTIQATDSDFLALATKLAAEDIDAIFLAVPAEVAANMAIQFRQAGVPARVRILGPSTIGSANYIRIGGKAVEGSLVVADYTALNPSPMNTAFVAAWKARYNVAPDNWAALGYTLGQVGVLAIKNAGPNPDRAKIRDALTKLRNVPVVLGNGTWTMDAARHPTYGGAVLAVKNGAFTVAP